MGWRQPGPGDRTGETPEPGAGIPGSIPGGAPSRDPGFAKGGAWDTCPPSAVLATALEGASGWEWRCPGATDDELAGLLRQWAAIESWAAAGRLGVIRAMIRSQDAPWLTDRRHGDLPDIWDPALAHAMALALATSVGAAQDMAVLAWELEARLPGIGSWLADGRLTLSKARMVADEFRLLTDENAARAEELLLDWLSGAKPKTYTQLLKLAQRAACTVDPELIERRRKHAEKNDARVELWREQSGAAGLAGRNLPTDEALAAMASVNARAQLYRDSGAFGDATMDQLRTMAYLDLLNEVTAEARIAHAKAVASAAQPGGGDGPGNDGGEAPGDPGTGDGPGDLGGPGGGGGQGPGKSGGPDGDPEGGDPESADRDGTVPTSPLDDPPPEPPPLIRPRADLTIPLLTLLGLAQRPGEGVGLGILDPDLCRQLAATAARYPASQLCVTVTDMHGFAVGHGCAKPARTRISQQSQPPPPPRLAALPARVNLTIPATLLSVLGRRVRAPAGWTFTAAEGPGPPDGYGTWTLVLPGGRRLTVNIEPVPTHDCDHRHESHAYEPNDRLRHLVQIRDGECTFPPCTRHARESDFEHALAYHKGGRTCACNAGARSRRCHRTKQSPGWKVTQPKPGWHQWTTPAGRVYTQEPKHYPA